MSGVGRAALLLALAAAGCGEGPVVQVAPPLEFTVGTVTVRLVSGGVVRGSVGGPLTFYLTDQIDTCAAVKNAPTLTTTYLQLVVASPTAGPLAATVVAPKLNPPSPGEALGKVEQTTGLTVDATIDAADGTVTWSAGATGDVILETIDVGFAATSGRVTATGLRLTACN